MITQEIGSVTGIRVGDKAAVTIPDDDSCVILEAENRLQMIQVFLKPKDAVELATRLMEGATVISWNSVEDRLVERKTDD